MKQFTSHSSHRRKCIKCKRKTGDAFVLSQKDIEIRIPVCADCSDSFAPDEKLRRFKIAFGFVDMALDF